MFVRDVYFLSCLCCQYAIVSVFFNVRVLVVFLQLCSGVSAPRVSNDMALCCRHRVVFGPVISRSILKYFVRTAVPCLARSRCWFWLVFSLVLNSPSDGCVDTDERTSEHRCFARFVQETFNTRSLSTLHGHRRFHTLKGFLGDPGYPTNPCTGRNIDSWRKKIQGGVDSSVS